MSESKKTCFVVTPIGNADSPIRRHIDGIIDQAIIPALEERYEIEVAHRKYEIGSINDRVIKSIYSSELVIVNLTELNPNVMFELAIRYSFGKPAIVIAEVGTKLPFDIIDENTIFYINDPAGANDLKNKLIEFETNINLEKKDYGPVYKAINTIPLYQEVESGKVVSNNTLLDYILERLNDIDRNLRRDQHFDFNLFLRLEKDFQETEKVINVLEELIKDRKNVKWYQFLTNNSVKLLVQKENGESQISDISREIVEKVKASGIKVEDWEMQLM